MSADAVRTASACVERLMLECEDVVVTVSDCDLSVVDAVAHMRLLARRYARALVVVGADEGLFETCGLEDVL